MTINTKLNVPVETFCGEYSPTAVSNVVPEQEKKNIFFFSEVVFLRFSEKQRPIKPKKVLMDTKTNKKADKDMLITKLNLMLFTRMLIGR